MSTARARISPAAMQDFAGRIVNDERWEVLREEFHQEMFGRWTMELDREKRDQIYAEYLGFSLFCSKLNALANRPKPPGRPE